jgi:hypothetical protein
MVLFFCLLWLDRFVPVKLLHRRRKIKCGQLIVLRRQNPSSFVGGLGQKKKPEP